MPFSLAACLWEMQQQAIAHRAWADVGQCSPVLVVDMQQQTGHAVPEQRAEATPMVLLLPDMPTVQDAFCQHLCQCHGGSGAILLLEP